MEVILLKTCKQGRIGDIVRVKDGFGRNYLLPRGIAQRATEANKAAFALKKAELEAANLALLESAEALKGQLGEASVTLHREASNDMKLYGAVSEKDIVEAIKEKYSLELDSKLVLISHRIKNIGNHEVKLQLHHDVIVSLEVVVAAKNSR